MENIDSVRGLQKLVQDPTEVFMNLMQKLVKDMVFEFMATTGVDTTIIKKCVNKSILVKMNSWIALTYLDCTIRSLNSVMDTKHTLESLKTQKLFDDVESLISEHVCTQNFIRIYSNAIQVTNYIRYVEQQYDAAVRFEFPWGAEYCFPLSIRTGKYLLNTKSA